MLSLKHEESTQRKSFYNKECNHIIASQNCEISNIEWNPSGVQPKRCKVEARKTSWGICRLRQPRVVLRCWNSFLQPRLYSSLERWHNSALGSSSSEQQQWFLFLFFWNSWPLTSSGNCRWKGMTSRKMQLCALIVFPFASLLVEMQREHNSAQSANAGQNSTFPSSPWTRKLLVTQTNDSCPASCNLAITLLSFIIPIWKTVFPKWEVPYYSIYHKDDVHIIN